MVHAASKARLQLPGACPGVLFLCGSAGQWQRLLPTVSLQGRVLPSSISLTKNSQGVSPFYMPYMDGLGTTVPVHLWDIMGLE